MSTGFWMVFAFGYLTGSAVTWWSCREYWKGPKR